ncbi:helix-turn-helix domain-containing protein [Schaedlerella arabinosiphila]|uniref:helix-turn-helix domain-containing protein n=1 Tax=Schaedlerella arabinosiphila TaxID=2044587 RepID=UPI002F4043BB
MSDFIMRRKLEEGKSLLAYSEKSISEISEYLCFSSQSYFQNVFKKKYHMTPYEYRKSMR